jgi:hypothetical protein
MINASWKYYPDIREIMGRMKSRCGDPGQRKAGEFRGRVSTAERACVSSACYTQCSVHIRGSSGNDSLKITYAGEES